MQSLKLLIALTLAAALAVFLPGIFRGLSARLEDLPSSQTAKSPDPAALAKCLTQKGFVMYGTEWCPNCKKQKEQFGSAFRFVKEIDCDEEPEICAQQNIKGYPVWEDASGKQYPGAKPLSALAELSGCG